MMMTKDCLLTERKIRYDKKHMVFIFGLGNPGKEYEKTRHNAGFFVLDLLSSKLGYPAWKLDKKFQSMISMDSGAVLVKPQTFMNASGQAVQSVLHYYDKNHASQVDELDHVFVVYDDLDMQLGQYKVQLGIHPKIHNGVNSIISTIHTDRFWNVRIGTDGRNGDRSIPSEKYVLTSFSKEEQEVLDGVLRQVSQELYAKIIPSQSAL